MQANAFEIATALASEFGGGVTKTGGQYLTRCPSHADRSASLAIRDAQVGPLVYCHAGCAARDVIAALLARGLWDHREREHRPAARSSRKPHDDTAERRALALKLWHRRRPVEATIAETYLREHRGITCSLPRTLGFIPALGAHPAALIAAFGVAHETEPGVIAITEDRVQAVHLTKLTADGRKHPDNPAKIMIGRAPGSPIIIAPMNDLLGLGICEGVEDALSHREATGLGMWAAGSANRMPGLADAVPDYCDCCTIFADSDQAGQRNAAELAERLNARGIFAEVMPSSGTAS